LGAALGSGVANYVLAVSATTIAGVYEILLRLSVVSLLGLIFGQIIYRIILWYPSAVTNIRKTGINVDLPNAVSFMYAMSKGGMNLIEIFKSLSEHADIYGEAAKEISVIVKDIEFFGHDIQTALRNISDITPSEKFRDFAEGLISVIAAGGSVSIYFSTKSRQYQIEAVQEQKTFLEMLGMIGEMYVTALVAGPLFLIVTVVVMSMMGSEQTLLLNVIIYAVIPFASLGFIVMLDTMSKSTSGGGRTFYTTTKELKVFEVARVEAGEGGERERGLFKAIKWHIRKEKLMDFLKNPFKLFYEEPKRTLYLSVPIALTYFFIKAYPYLQAITFRLAMPTGMIASKGMVDNYIIFAVLISLTPFAIFYELRERRIKKIEEAMPDFLRGLASSQEVGMTLPRAIKMVLASNLGVLSSEVRRIWRDIEWGSPVRDAFVRFENRVKTGFVARTVTLITKASEVSGNIKDVLSIAATDAQVTRTMKDERKMNMFMYVIVVYISFGVFLLIVYVLAATFLPLMPTSGAQMGAGGGMGMGGGGIDIDLYTRLFFHAALIQGFFSGLIAGHMGEGHVFSGIKHALIMVTISFLVFTLFI
jgi:flagellar protein FlaJ